MAKLTREQKIEIYKKRKAGESIMALSKQYDINYGNVKYLVKLIDRHGEDILRKDKNKQGITGKEICEINCSNIRIIIGRYVNKLDQIL